MYKEISNLIKNNDKTIYRWKKEQRPIISLLEKYFTKSDLEEFLETGEIQKYNDIKFFYDFAEKVCDEFFYEPYSRKDINRIFSNVIFPEFEKSFINSFEELKREIIILKEKIKKCNDLKQKENYQSKLKYTQFRLNSLTPAKYFKKSNIYKFIIENNFESKEELIQTLEKYNDIEIYMLVKYYKKFLGVMS